MYVPDRSRINQKDGYSNDTRSITVFLKQPCIVFSKVFPEEYIVQKVLHLREDLLIGPDGFIILLLEQPTLGVTPFKPIG